LLQLESRSDTSYVAIFADFETDHLTIRNKKRSSSGSTEDSIVDQNQLVDDSDSASRFANKVREALSVTGSGQILLALAWTNDVATRKLTMFPEFTSSDTTESTNAEERPLWIFTAKDSNNQGFPHTWAFLPNLSRWVFSWCFGTAMPALHPPSVLARIQICTMDEDAQENAALRGLAGRGRLYENVSIRNCAFHKIHRNFLHEAAYKNAHATTQSHRC